MKNIRVTLILISLLTLQVFGTDWVSRAGGQFSIIQSSHAPFPHPERMNGHQYGDQVFTFDEHYNDSSIAIFIPKGFKSQRYNDLVFYFHGWGNNIEKSIENFRLLEQFTKGGKNAILVIPQGPRNSKDSFGGRLEDPNTFKALVEEVLETLFTDIKIRSTRTGNIVLAGHSGAYHVISAILSRGGLSSEIKEVYLFDALYGQLEKFTHWLETETDTRLVNIVTPNGGTLDNSLDLLDDLRDWGIPFAAYEQNVVSLEDLQAEKVITIFTTLGHSEVIDPFFERALRSSK